jgi:RNA polymerase sigma-70 factor (ECF subfamily)
MYECYALARNSVKSVDTKMDVSATIGFRAAMTSPRVAQDRSQEVSARPVDEVEPDEHLMCKVNRGDRDALSLLFRRYVRVVRSLGRRILRDDGEADDLVQEVFLYVHRKSALYDPSKGAARSWIFQVAYTQAFLRRRRLRSHGFYASGIADKLPEIEQQTHLGADYDLTVEGLFGRNGWRKILEALTEEQRETLKLHFFEGYTFNEIAEKLGQSYANVRNHHYRGLEKLRKHLADSELNRR